jgi:hypothetical protein
MPVDTVEAECAKRTLKSGKVGKWESGKVGKWKGGKGGKGGKVGKWKGGKGAGFTFAPSYLHTFAHFHLCLRQILYLIIRIRVGFVESTFALQATEACIFGAHAFA